jgi:hypothetical protein
MKSLAKIWLTVIFFSFNSYSHAEDWPTLSEYVAKCVLIIEARQIGPFSAEKDARLSFEVIECWKGDFKPDVFEYLTKENYFMADQGEHGVNIGSSGQKIIFFFTQHNQPEGKLKSHSTAFPIKDGKVVYAATGNPGTIAVFSVDEFKQKITELGTTAKK